MLAGRSLEETERRVTQFGDLIALAWALTLGGLLAVVLAGSWVLESRSAAL